MALYEKYAEALEARDIVMLAALCHPNFEMVMHSSGSVASKNEYLKRLGPLIQNSRLRKDVVCTKMKM